MFFVRSFEGDSEYDGSNNLYLDRPPGTRKVRVEFADGELVVGYMTAYDPRRPGSFFSPLDPKSNNTKIFAVSAAVMTVTRSL